MERFQFATMAALLTGVAFAGAIMEALAVITYERIGFGLLFRRGRLGWLALPLIIMAGPLILVREAFALARSNETGRMLAYGGLAVMIGLALAWAVASGHILLRIIAVVQPRIFS